MITCVQISFITLAIIKAVTSLRQVSDPPTIESPARLSLSTIVNVILNGTRHTHGDDELSNKGDTFVNRLLRSLNFRKKMEVDLNDFQDTQAKLIENELKSALAHKKSALYDKPYVLNQGKNDFLVMRPDFMDPYVTIVPNSIYYNIEKKCVNWLDDCNLQGIRARLLRGVKSPYKK